MNKPRVMETYFHASKIPFQVQPLLGQMVNIVDVEGRPVAFAGTEFRSKRENEANAILLTASANSFFSLLEAGQSAADWLCESKPGTDQWERGQKLRMAIKNAIK